MNYQVNDVEDRLREAYRAAADTISPESVRSPREPMAGHTGRRRAMRPRVLVPLAAAAAIVAVAVAVPVALSALPGVSGLKPAGPGRSATPAQAPHEAIQPAIAAPLIVPDAAGDANWFFFTSDGGPGTTLDVYRTSTARLVASVSVPHPGDDFYAVAATADRGAFVVAVGHAYTCGTHLYILRLRPDGTSAGYTALPVPTLPEDVNSLAVTPDTHSLAYAGEYCTDPAGGQGDIGYVNLATRTISRWTAPKQEDIGSLSLSADGGEIGFVVGATKLFAPEAGLLATDATSGTLAQRAQVIVSDGQLRPAGTVPEAVALSPDGRTMYVCGAAVQTGSTPPPTTPDPLLAFSGLQLTHTSHLAGAGSCGLSLDPSGRHLLAQTSGGYGTGTPAVQLIDVATGKATTLPVPVAALRQGVQVFW